MSAGRLRKSWFVMAATPKDTILSSLRYAEVSKETYYKAKEIYEY